MECTIDSVAIRVEQDQRTASDLRLAAALPAARRSWLALRWIAF
jgi:hypothetical protein